MVVKKKIQKNIVKNIFYNLFFVINKNTIIDENIIKIFFAKSMSLNAFLNAAKV